GRHCNTSRKTNPDVEFRMCHALPNAIAPVISAAVFLALMSAVPATAASAAENVALQVESKIPLGNVAGRIDHLAIDGKRQNLFIAELGNNTVGVVDLAKRAIVHRMTGL